MALKRTLRLVARVSLMGVLAVSFAAPSFAQWLYQGEPSAFGGAGSQIVLTGNGSYGFGFRCDDDGPIAVYLTPEEVSDEAAKALLLLAPMLLVRVDDGEAKSMLTLIDRADGKLRISAPAEQSLVEEVKTAKRRVAVAVKMGDKVFHEQSFSASGSTSSISKFLKNCHSP